MRVDSVIDSQAGQVLHIETRDRLGKRYSSSHALHKHYQQRSMARTDQTLAEMLFYLNDRSERTNLEVFRINYETEHGRTDLTKRYTSTWPPHQQEWLLDTKPQLWFDGLPPFIQSYIRQRVVALVEDGVFEHCDTKTCRLDRIQTGPGEHDSIQTYWVKQYLEKYMDTSLAASKPGRQR